MTVVFDPLWPWSLAWELLYSAGAVLLLAALLFGLWALVLPVLLRLRPLGRPASHYLRHGLVVLAALAVTLALACWREAGLSGGPRLFGLALLLASPFALLGVTAWNYLAAPGARPRRVAALLALRTAALLLTAVALLRPALGFLDEARRRSVLYVAVDASRSMTIRDEPNSRSRWELALATLDECRPLIDRLRDERHIDVALHRFGASLEPFDPDAPGEADGPRTDTGAMLRNLHEAREGNVPLRGLAVISDGADNGTRFPPLDEAARWRRIPCPVHAFASGNPTTSDRLNDIALVGIQATPSPVPIKGKLSVKVVADAPGFEGRTVRLRLFLDDKEATARDAVLDLTGGNEFTLECPAPPRPGEVRVTVKLEDGQKAGEPPPGDRVPNNNVIETFVNVTKEGLSVLLVDKRRAWEPIFLSDALDSDPRIRLEKVWLMGGRPVRGGEDLFRLDDPERAYDVIILGDVTPEQIQAINPRALEQVRDLVKGGAGLLMLGGYASLGNSTWGQSPLKEVLPIDFARSRGRDGNEARMVPTDAGLAQYGYLLRIDDADPKRAWESLFPLEGLPRLAPTDAGTENVLAVTGGANPRPILVTRDYGGGRVLVFAGDTTHRWVRDPDGQRMHSQFWRRMAVWLARQEDQGGSAWVTPDVRRLPAETPLGFRVGVRSKGGADLADGTYRAEVVGPDGKSTPVLVARKGEEDRGTFAGAPAAGVYQIKVTGEAKDPSTGEVIKGEASARFLVYEEDLEMTRRAADHEFLDKLAAAGGGQSRRVEELADYLSHLLQQPADTAGARLDLWPEWGTTRRSPFLVGFFVAFIALVSGEWLLRRRWGMA